MTILKKVLTEPEYIFLIVATLASVLIFFTPAYSVPDEVNHFYRYYQISNLTFVSQQLATKNGYPIIGDYLPKSLSDSVETTLKNAEYNHGYRLNISKVKEELKRPLEKSITVPTIFPNTSLYPPATYLPQSLAVSVGNIANLPPIALMYLARIANYLFFVLLVFFAIKITPLGKNIFLLSAVTPVSLYIATSSSGDVPTISISLFYTAFIFFLAFSQTAIEKKHLIFLFILTILLDFSKQPYFLLTGLFLLIPIKKFSSRLAYLLLFISLLTTTAICLSLWQLQIKDQFMPFRNYLFSTTFDINPTKQLIFILTQPLEYIKILLSNFHFLKILTGFYQPRTNSEVTVVTSRFFEVISIGLLVITIFADKVSSVALNVNKKLLLLVLFFIITGAIMTLMYLSFNGVGLKKIDGVQPRYFIPLIPLLFLVFTNSNVKFHINDTILKSLLLLIPCLGIIYLVSIAVGNY